MKVAAILFAVISLSALALAGPAFNKNQNQVEADKAKQQYMSSDEIKQTAAIESLKQWCFSSKMSQPELTASFKKLVSIVESQPEDKNTESAVMSERICQQNQKSTDGSQQVDPQAHELIKDVYMDSLIACESRKCMQQLIKIINSQQVDTIRASYYMTRIAVTETESIKKDDSQAKELADAFVRQPEQSQSEAIERQKLFALTSLIAKTIKAQKQPASTETKKMAQDVAKTIVERYVKTVSQDEVQQYKQQPAEQQSSQVARKIAKRSAALKALSNLPGPVICEVSEIEQTLKRIAEDKQELSTVRQSAIECLEQCESAMEELKKLAFDQEEQIEVRITAYRALISVAFNGQAEEQRKQQVAEQIIDQVVKHCEQQRNQQQDDQFVLYAISHLDNLRTSQQPEHKAIRECIAKNKQHYMQIQLLVKKFKQQLNQITKSSRNYKLEQEFNQLESGLIVEGDIVYESKNKQQKWGQQVLPKLMRVNMSMPVMGETVNVIEISLRQDNMDEELMGALKLVQTGKFNSETMSKVVDTFKTSVESSKRSDKKQTAEADLTIKVDGCTVVYVCIDDVKSIMSESDKSRYTRSVSYSSNLVDQLIEQLRRKPVSFNRGFNFNLNQILAKVLRVEANLIAGLRFESRATGQSSKDFEIVVKAEPRFGFETIVGPAKMSSKKLLQRISTKTALGLRLRFKQDELVDVQLDLPLNTMELFTFETQMVEKNNQQDSYSYLPESIYGQQDIYQPREGFYPSKEQYYEEDYENDSVNFSGLRKRSVFDNNKKSTLSKVVSGKHSRYAQTVEVPEQIARATGLRGKLRFVAKPRDMSFLVSAFVEKYEPSMQGYRMQLEKVQRAQVEEQYVLTLSTPGSSVDRTMSVRVSMASTKLHTVVKTDIKSPFVGASAQFELIDDNRQYAVKALIASTRGKQWRHQFEAGVQRGSQSPAGRIATTYKPYLNVQSTALRRPVQLSGAFSFQQSPKTVINYELKCQTTGDYVQGKIMLDERQSSWASKRSMRSMQHSLELLLQKDVTLTSELVAQVSEHAFKVHKMLDWEPSKLLMVADLSASHKNLRKSYENELVANMKLSDKQQVLIVERKSPQQQHKQFRITIDSQFQTPTSHQLIYQARYSNKRVQNAQVAYKHQIELNQISARKFELIGQAELLAPEYQIDEKYQTRTQVDLERKLKSVHCQINSKDNKKVKFDMDFVSFGEHQIELQLQGERISHKCSVRADDRQFAVQSRTDKQGSMIAKMAVEVQKKLNEGQLIVEVPSKKVQLVADLKPSSGKVSSFALRTERFASKAEFSFETIARSMRNNKFFGSFLQQLKFKTDLKDMTNQEAYWMDSAWNSHKDQDSYLRFDSPVYRTDLEYSPREQMSKLGMYAREKRSTDTYKTLYSLQDSLLGQTLDKKIDLGNKMWMLRSSIPTASKLDEIKQKARRAIFQYADRRQQQQHQIDYNPFEDRLSLDFDRQAYNANDNSMRFTGDIDTRFQTPSSFSLKSDWMNMDVEAKPFDGQELYGKIKANSRHPRSAFKEHDSQLSYNKQQGYKAYMKHTDKKNHKHQVEFEADKRPENWTKMSWNSDKHGKGHYEHNWQKHVKQGRQAEMYDNSLSLSHEAPRWSHNTQLSFEQPRMSQNKRFARDTYSTIYRPYDYLKQISARLNSQTSLDKQGQLYKLDFDFKPESHARFNLDMPAYELTHNSALEYEPTERTYKLQSRLFSKRQQQPEYEFVARTKPVRGLATADQEPVFVTESHPMFEQPISNKLYANLFKQPLKVDYNDRFGRVASFDYDLLPVDSSSVLKSVIKNGLRQKRAAFYYKNAEADFEHDSKYDFYPESFLTKFKPEGKKSFDANVAIKSHTKYGPVVIRVDSNDKSQQVSVDTPVVDAKLTGISNGRDQAVYRLKLDNKQQQVQLAKIVRQTPVLRDSKLVQKIAQKIDNGRLEHETELVLSLLETIFKVHSQTKLNDRQVLLIDGELNHPEEKLVVKIDGERVDGQLLVDLIKQTADFDYLVDNGRTVSHQTRLVRSSNKYFTMDSMTTYKGRPWAKIAGKLSSAMFDARSSSRFTSQPEQMSSIEAVVYQPTTKQFNCEINHLKNSARIIVKDAKSKNVQETNLIYNQQSESVLVDTRLVSPYGQVYKSQAKINLTGFMYPNKCQHGSQSCQSELIFSSAQQGNWAAKYIPNEYITINTPHGKQSFDLVY